MSETICGICGGPAMFLGKLGTTTVYRCRNCGADYIVTKKYPVVTAIKAKKLRKPKVTRKNPTRLNDLGTSGLEQYVKSGDRKSMRLRRAQAIKTLKKRYPKQAEKVSAAFNNLLHKPIQARKNPASKRPMFHAGSVQPLDQWKLVERIKGFYFWKKFDRAKNHPVYTVTKTAQYPIARTGVKHYNELYAQN